MHLHDALRLWRSEIVSQSPHVALASDDLRGVDPGLLEGLTRETLPGGLRRDDKTGVQAVLAPAEHRPGRPATGDDLDALEQALGGELPRAVELLLSLHDGGEFFVPTLEGLPAPLDAPLTLLSCREMIEAYSTLLAGIAGALQGQDAHDDTYFRLARRFGASQDQAGPLGDQLARIASGVQQGLEILPLARVAGGDDLILYVPRSGKVGRVGHAYAVSQYLPEHSDEFPFDGLEGWLEALVRGKGCRRVVL